MVTRHRFLAKLLHDDDDHGDDDLDDDVDDDSFEGVCFSQRVPSWRPGREE